MSSGQAQSSRGSFPSAEGGSHSNAQSWPDRCCEELSQAVERNPSGTLMTAFGIGLGVGTVLALSVAASLPRPKPRIKSSAEKARDRAQELGNKILESIQEALHDVVPDSIAKRF